jgi:hypothetical protein
MAGKLILDSDSYCGARTPKRQDVGLNRVRTDCRGARYVETCNSTVVYNSIIMTYLNGPTFGF